MRRQLLLLALLAAPVAARAQDIPPAEFAARRDSLAARVENGVVVAYGGRTLVHDFHTFFQLPAFRYLTNVDEPDAALVMVVRNGRGTSTLFLAPIDPRMGIYYGQRTDSAKSLERFGIPGRSIGIVESVLDSLADSGLPFYNLADFEDADFARVDTLTRGQGAMDRLVAAHPDLVVRNAHPFVNALRARKSPAEMALLRRAAEISADGHRAAMTTRDPRHEYELRAALESTFIRMGAERPAYGSIVGAGVNGTQLHYMKDTGPVRPGDLVVMDAAAEYHGYAADITRTIPVDGVYTQEQRRIYQLVLDAQAVAERNSRAGVRPSVGADSSYTVRAKGLAELGLIESEDAMLDPPWNDRCTPQSRDCEQAYFWTIHGISHGLGLAVHDPMQSSFGDRTYQVGDAFTLEPGIYISTRALELLPDTPRNRAFIARVRDVVRRYENTGVRIEDDYLITERGLERISSGVPREIAEIEALMRPRTRP